MGKRGRGFSPNKRGSLVPKIWVAYDKLYDKAVASAKSMRGNDWSDMSDIIESVVSEKFSKFSNRILRKYYCAVQLVAQSRDDTSQELRDICDVLFSVFCSAAQTRNPHDAYKFILHCVFVICNDKHIGLREKSVVRKYLIDCETESETPPHRLSRTSQENNRHDMASIIIIDRINYFKWPRIGISVCDKYLLPSEKKCLAAIGYRTGRAAGLHEVERRRILERYICSNCLFGSTESIKRLMFVAHVIAVNVRRANGHDPEFADYRRAIREWKSDLAYLKSKYYDRIVVR